MLVSSYLKKNQIELNLKATNKEESIKELAALLKNSKEIIDFEAFLNDVLNREALSTTGVGNEIAIPHARSSSVSDFIIAFGRSSKGIEFGSLDKKPAKLIFLMGTTKTKNLRQYLQLLAKLTRLLKDEPFKNALMKAQNAEDILKTFKKAGE